jgi:hypothetical protein
MKVPPPIASHLQGRGKILSVGVTLIAAVFSVLAFGVIGAAALVAGIVLLTLIELWVDSGRLVTEIQGLKGRRDDLQTELQLTNRELLEARERADRVPALEADVRRHLAEIEALRRELATPQATLQHLLEALVVQVQMIDTVKKHRLLEAQGLSEWPVLRASLDQDAGVVVKAFVTAPADQLSGEWVALVDRAAGSHPICYGRVILAGEQEVSAALNPGDVPQALLEDVEERGSVAATGLALRPAGLCLSPYNEIDNGGLEGLRERLTDVMNAVSKALAPPGTADLMEGEDT